MSVAAVMLAAVLAADGRPSTVDAKAVAQALAQSIIGPEVPLAEVRAFCESKIPPMPQPRSVGEWEQFAHSMREAVLTEVIFRGEARRWRDTPGRVQWLDTLPAGPGYVIKKLRYEAVPGLWIPALLYEPTSLKGRVPVVLNVNGHDGKGKAAPYKQIRCINQAKRGMLALNVEWVGMGQLRQPGFVHYRMNQLDLCGTSGIAVYYLAMSRALDVLLDHPHADPKRVAVAGLSGGGWQTIFISSRAWFCPTPSRVTRVFARVCGMSPTWAIRNRRRRTWRPSPTTPN
ncbi:MAG: acetylxylan esterase [Planctomycetes bacterium]|nr:acetylxylan esterase [Planctomycetota bacterium]